MIRLPHTRGCFVCGVRNPSGLKLDFETDGERVTARFVLARDHCGFHETIHGGILATILDEVMVWACGVRTRRFAYCAEMTVRYLNPAKPGETIVATGEMEEDKRGRIFLARGELATKAGVRLATSTGKYMPLKPELQSKMLEDFVEAFDERIRPIGEA